eukprot:GHRR01033875.1.p1 GENE.GHRR01033875.1~~GHRR01033875.1.p1  ORF type:complete len:160 (-),score=35.76 GHRR01033875.1:90-569(-)
MDCFSILSTMYCLFAPCHHTTAPSTNVLANVLLCKSNAAAYACSVSSNSWSAWLFFCIQLNSVVYVGDGRSREVVRAFEFSSSTSAAGSNRSRPYAFEVLITTYELGLKDAELLGKVHWAYLMVDEAHRLKNSESALYQVGCVAGSDLETRHTIWRDHD